MEQPYKQRVCVLVKAYPQPSQKYEETVCCAAVTEDRSQLLRLYPIRYRHLSQDQKFDRFDIVEMEIWRAKGDYRPESYKVVEDSIQILRRKSRVPDEQKVRCWLPFVVDSLPQLEDRRKETHQSLGIIKPDPGSVEFVIKPAQQESEEDRSLSQSVQRQISLIEDPLKPLEAPEYVFGYHFTSGGKKFYRTILDWEVQAAWFNYKRRYGSDALVHLKAMYQETFPNQNLHFIMGNMLRLPKVFMIVGLLRTKMDIEMVAATPELF